MGHRIEVTPDGWIVDDLRIFRTLTNHAPPRRWGYWDQVRADVHEPKIRRMWAAGVGSAAAGVGLVAAAAVSGRFLLPGGLLVLGALAIFALWVRMAGGVIRGVRAHPVATGVVHALRPHPARPADLAVGWAARTSGGEVPVQAEWALAREFERAGTPAEVWFVDDPAFEHRPVFAVRPVGHARGR